MLKIPEFYTELKRLAKSQGINVIFKRKFCNIARSMNRKWKYLNQTENAYNRGTDNCFKLLSYNILAQDLLIEHSHLYYKINHEMLRWDRRLKKICKEISDIGPDILCLQEMQFDHVKQLVSEIISVEHKKWEYVFKKKTGTRSDGCIIIYDKNKFKLISERCVEYYTVGVPKLNRENIGVMLKFQEKITNTLFVVATTHLLYNPKREDVRVYQVNKLIDAIIDFSSTNRLSNDQLPVILTGDFNFTSHGQAFQALTSLRTLQSNSGKNESNQCSSKLYFQLDAIDCGNSHCASTLHHEWITVDYILKSANRDKNSLQVNSIYKLPSLQECSKIEMIPNSFVGSDHFLLAVKFIIR